MPAIHYQDCRIDDHSQRMLAALVDGQRTVSALTEEAGLSGWDKTDYRLRSMAEVGLVEQSRADPKSYRLTKEGRELVEDEGLMAPTLDDVRETAIEAQRDAKSAKESVQSYRQKVSRLKKKVNNLDDDEGMELITAEGRTKSLENHISSLIQRSDRLYKELNEIEESMATQDELEEVDEVSYDDLSGVIAEVNESIGNAEGRLNKKRKKLEKRMNEAEPRIEDHNSRLNDLEERVEEVEGRTLRDFLPF